MDIYKDIFFVIDSNNYSENNKDLFFGYKTVEDEGFWLDVKHRPNRIHIYSSTISPVIVLYEKDKYWAISNSCYYLVEYLKQKNINLEINSKFLEYESKTKTSFSYKYYSNILLYSDLKIIENKYEVDIYKGKLRLIDKNINFFSSNVEFNLDQIWKWYSKYQNFLLTKDNLICALSGGLDSRFLWYSFVRNNPKSEICCHPNKPNVADNMDEDLAKKVVYYYTGTELVSEELPSNRNTSSSGDISEFESNDFFYGLVYNPMKLTKKDYSLTTRLVGTGSNLFRYEFKDNNFLEGNIRRNWVSLFIARYYLLNRLYVTPYLDSILLNLNTEEPDYLHVILYSLFGKSLLTNNIPFITKSKNGPYKFQELRKDLFDRFSKISRYK